MPDRIFFVVEEDFDSDKMYPAAAVDRLTIFTDPVSRRQNLFRMRSPFKGLSKQ